MSYLISYTDHIEHAASLLLLLTLAHEVSNCELHLLTMLGLQVLPSPGCVASFVQPRNSFQLYAVIVPAGFIHPCSTDVSSNIVEASVMASFLLIHAKCMNSC